MPLRLRDKILIVAAELDTDYEGGDFTVETLAVRSWERYSDTFGLRGYSLPDSGMVFAKICDLTRLGLLERTRESCVWITQAGRTVAKELVRTHAAESAR